MGNHLGQHHVAKIVIPRVLIYFAVPGDLLIVFVLIPLGVPSPILCRLDG